MTIYEFAKKLNGRKYRKEITPVEEKEAKELGFIVLFGYSDDNAELRGSIDDEIGCWNGGRVYKNGDLFVDAVWCKDDFSWTYETNIPHATFDIYDDDEKYCRGIVFENPEFRSRDKSTGDEQKKCQETTIKFRVINIHTGADITENETWVLRPDGTLSALEYCDLIGHPEAKAVFDVKVDVKERTNG